MYTNIETIKTVSYNESGRCEKIDTYVDGDLFKSVESYYDKEGYLIYEYTNDKPAYKLVNEHKNSKKQQTKISKTLKKHKKRY